VNDEPDVSWWQRLLFGFLALAPTLLLLEAWAVLGALRLDPNAQWSNGGIGQVVGFTGIMGGIACLATYILFVVPIVLLWPAWSQRTHWYAMLAVSMLWQPIATMLLLRQHPVLALQQIPHSPSTLLLPESLALLSCGSYLLLIRWRGRPKRHQTNVQSQPGANP